MQNLMNMGLSMQAASLNQYYREVYPSETLANAQADAKRNGVSLWVNIATEKCVICKTKPYGNDWHGVDGIIQ